jgi:Rad3-related DNA helicase
VLVADIEEHVAVERESRTFSVELEDDESGVVTWITMYELGQKSYNVMVLSDVSPAANRLSSG